MDLLVFLAWLKNLSLVSLLIIILILTLLQVLPYVADHSVSVLLIGLVDHDGYSHGNGGQNEAKKDSKVPLVATATASFTASTHHLAASHIIIFHI
jgi:hypothetical protein